MLPHTAWPLTMNRSVLQHHIPVCSQDPVTPIVQIESNHVCNMFSTACPVSARARWLLHCPCLRVLSLARLPTAVASGHLTGIAARNFREGVLHSGFLKGLGLEIGKSVNPLKKLSRDSQSWSGVMSPPKSRAAPLQKSSVHFCASFQRSVLPFPPHAYLMEFR